MNISQGDRQHPENVLTPQEAAAQFEMLVNYRMPQFAYTLTQARVASSIPSYMEALAEGRPHVEKYCHPEYLDVLDYVLEKINTNPACFVFIIIRASDMWRLDNAKSELLRYGTMCGVALRDITLLLRTLRDTAYDIDLERNLIADFNTDYKAVSELPEAYLEDHFESEDESWLNGIVGKPESKPACTGRLEDYFGVKDRIWLQKTSLKIDFPKNQQG